jgi:hypothetical protein
MENNFFFERFLFLVSYAIILSGTLGIRFRAVIVRTQDYKSIGLLKRYSPCPRITHTRSVVEGKFDFKIHGG